MPPEFDVIQPRSFLYAGKWKHRSAFSYFIVYCLFILALLAGCDLHIPSVSLVGKPAAPEHLVPKILSVWPHDPSSYTEGLLWYNGFLIESSGLYGQSYLRKVDPQTGSILQRVNDPTAIFGEGVALDGNRLFQLTWREHIGYIYNLGTLTQVGTISYAGEGWGLCFDGSRFFMSDGTASIQIRDSTGFAAIGHLQVVLNGKPVDMLNELECVGDSIYANVWMTNNIVRIDKTTGEVTAVIDATGLLTPQELVKTGADGVLNGIAYDPTHQTFFITGKRWPKLFEVKFVPKGPIGFSK